uniref:Uncharacterized protein n=1 Tax=Anguilla anguilla TaxID=7936 RepID=A0A0E9XEP3_ANGAN
MYILISDFQIQNHFQLTSRKREQRYLYIKRSSLVCVFNFSQGSFVHHSLRTALTPRLVLLIIHQVICP